MLVIKRSWHVVDGRIQTSVFPPTGPFVITEGSSNKVLEANAFLKLLETGTIAVPLKHVN